MKASFCISRNCMQLLFIYYMFNQRCNRSSSIIYTVAKSMIPTAKLSFALMISFIFYTVCSPFIFSKILIKSLVSSCTGTKLQVLIQEKMFLFNIR